MFDNIIVFLILGLPLKNIIFCGGGSGGHVIPAVTIIRAIKEKDPECTIFALGSEYGIEAELFLAEKVNFKNISTGKLRRYLSFQNIIDIFKVMLGIFQSFIFLFKFKGKDSLVFSTGGFVSVPVVVAAFFQGKRIYIHEQTSRVGLANKICSIFADKILITFESSKDLFPKDKTKLLGYPLRKEILSTPPLLKVGDINLEKVKKPILFITGGGNGSLLLNEALLNIKDKLEEDFFIIHQSGKKFVEKLRSLESESYKVFDFIGEEMVSLLAYSDVVISRAGAGTVVELMALGRPSIFIPLKIAQKNEQFWNAKEAEKRLGSIVIEEDQLSSDILIKSIREIQNCSKGPSLSTNPTEAIIEEILGDDNAK